MMNGVAEQTEADIWNRMIQPERGSLGLEAARSLLTLKLPQVDLDRVNELSAKAREGKLSELEDRELESYLNVGRALELLKAKARASLKIAESV